MADLTALLEAAARAGKFLLRPQGVYTYRQWMHPIMKYELRWDLG
jgi:hypothetical protein